ncbi:DUF2513 domain-containing protein [Acetoanaerobium noterae]|uniref:DUF2513 domain-containing protein n=1 Tax=Acetoanaerobium noterae TaxID=745369 RepID=UPI00333FF94D
MKRNLDLIRHILLTIEESEKPRLTGIDFENENFDSKQISYHIQLLIDSSYIEASSFSSIGQGFPDFIVRRITNQGHDFIDSIRDNNVFVETKNNLLKVGGSASFEIVKSVATKVLEHYLGI